MGLADLFLEDPAARVVAAGVHMLVDRSAPGGAAPLAAELRMQFDNWQDRRPPARNAQLTKGHVKEVRADSERHKILGWFGECSYLRYLRKHLLDPSTLAACVLLDALCGGFEEGPGEELFAAALASKSPAVRIEAMFRWRERDLGPLPASLGQDPDAKAKAIYRRLSR